MMAYKAKECNCPCAACKRGDHNNCTGDCPIGD